MALSHVNMEKRAFLLSQLIQRLQRQKEPREGQLFGFRTDDGRLLAIALCTNHGNLKHDKSLLLPAPLTPIGKFEVTKGDHSKPEIEENEIAVIWDQEDLHVYVSEDQQISTTCFTELTEEDLSELFVLARINFTLDLTSRDTVVYISNTIQTLVEQLESPSTCFRLQDSTLILQNKDGGVLSLENQGGKGNVDIGSLIKGAKKKKASMHIVNFQMLQNRSTVTCRNAPVVRIDNRKSGILSTHFKGEAIVYLQKSCKVSKVAALLVQGVIQQLHLAECWLDRQLKDKLCGNLTSYNSLHFLSGHVVNVIYPENSDDKNLETYRKDVHEALMFPMNQPMVRKGNRLPIIEAKSSVLKNTHIGLKPSSVYGEISVVKGIYGYHHYMQDNFNDNKWGCAYRSLQTLVSWFRFQGYTEKSIPTHSEIQKCLVDIGDKPSSFLDSRQWIGSTEVGFVLDNMYNITSKFIFVSSGADLAEKGRELAHHFQTQGTPIMIGGGVLAHTIIGVDYNTESGDISFLILDPHYTGSEDLSTIQNKGWCGWKGPEFWDPKAYYNLCLPQRPLCI
ncbi:ufm1-specific protease 2-like [Penaeus chinensis]|uniref:ufm1-specific protease 2-like n=1 Tax=Penaeus chinensis TaxID=139456 RepID=UPI001FB6CB98|nr:ufm1-specific protease 2-like [Penaeus chinensis]